VWARGYCASHYTKARNEGLLASAPRVRRQKGTGTFRNGYHCETIDGSQKGAHILVAERALGKKLPKGAQVHHFNEDRSDNRPENLVVCPDYAYHALLHLRADALNAIGDPNGRKCTYCKQWDLPKNLQFRSNGAKQKTPSPKVFHIECRRKYRNAAYAKRHGQPLTPAPNPVS